ncbi:hypothetical protein [Motilimonas sp. KMU-193]|uniref:hypothetical protein n=1 Tax=Motilimonas sp. KMU-193 TaxID=3388668 RepID=UPI00396B4702
MSKYLSITLLFILVLGTSSSALGEARSHGFSSHAHTSEHHSHQHNHDESFHHDASSHNHNYDAGNIKSLSQVSFAQLSQSRFIRQNQGIPIRKPFKIERPPKHP